MISQKTDWALADGVTKASSPKTSNGQYHARLLASIGGSDCWRLSWADVHWRLLVVSGSFDRKLFRARLQTVLGDLRTSSMRCPRVSNTT